MNKDYILLFDESGEPYLAHAWFQRKNHKYLKRVDNYYGQGKHLYLYTQREVDTFNRTGRVRLSARIKDKLGWDERSAYEDASEAKEKAANNLSKRPTGENILRSERAKKESDRTKNEYEKTITGKIDRLSTKLSEIRSNKNKSEESQKNVVESARSRPAGSENILNGSVKNDTKSPNTGEEAAKSPKLDDARKIALEVLRGEWGGGSARKENLEKAGYNYEAIQWLAGNMSALHKQGWNYNAITDEYLMKLPKKKEVQEYFSK